MASSDQSDWSSSEEIDNETGFSGGYSDYNSTKTINTGHAFSNTACVDCDCDIQICERDFQRTVNQPVMYR